MVLSVGEAGATDGMRVRLRWDVSHVSMSQDVHPVKFMHLTCSLHTRSTAREYAGSHMGTLLPIGGDVTHRYNGSDQLESIERSDEQVSILPV